MTAVLEPQDAVIELTPDDVRQSIKNALQRAECTFDELAEQARTGDFDSLAARLAWVAIGGFYGKPIGEV
ncbi:hypothetical protein GV794_02015 [Nocardia cyriacigeorgica]|uniref:Uncharacterized protein n=1 Tax=Nocardia cyriacigeorgica TaxID=135487 RepID=A0ABX0CGQ5_9NOCA|nr:hypothetical protein [Nocardia cyriacigeorgica]NEW42736.1 hypothetical protein [Nocardia cyriacigeorgica]NEW53969.1 hypothetical protein [Nocardia cyriacigeorgica]NEW54442.1 hypothetical protein [Nocardia cyriacigeorgica]